MMKKITLLAIVPLVLNSWAFAQRTSDQRTLDTKIVDILAVMPAKNRQQLDQNMMEIAGLGEDGIAALIGMVSPPGSGDNSQIEYALAGFAFHVMQNNKEEQRKMAVNAYCQALQKEQDIEIKAFIISQLQVIGKEEAISCLSDHLTDARLCGPAARALVKINSPASGKALMMALQGENGSCMESILVALGDLRYKGAIQDISVYATSSETTTRKLALYALANIGDTSSEKVLRRSAEKSSYGYSQDNATGSYIYFIQRLNETGDSRRAGKLAVDLFKKAGNKDQIHTQSAALRLLADIQGDKSMKTLVASAKGNSLELRAAAINAALPYINGSNLSLWTNKLHNLDPMAQADIISMFGKKRVKESLPEVRKALSNRDENVRLAAIKASGNIGQSAMVPEFLNILKSVGNPEIEAINEAFLTMEGEGLIDQIADALGDMPPHIQIELLNFLGAKAAFDRFDDVFSFVHNENKEVRQSALSALGEVGDDKHLPQLFELMNNKRDPKENVFVQQAIIKAIANSEDKNFQRKVLDQMVAVPEDQKSSYFNILASLGGKEGIAAVAEAYRTGNSATKSAALNALSRWSDFSAADELYRIGIESSSKDHKDQALKGYVRAISLSAFPSDQKVLLLKRAMNLANTPEQKKIVIRETGNNKIFPALVFAGHYLQDKDINQEAGLAVMNISLSNEKFTGSLVRNLLQETIKVLKGPDSEYQIESIKKFLAEMPDELGFESLINDDLTGWNGVLANPISKNKMSQKEQAIAQSKANEKMHQAWKVDNGELVFVGKGDAIGTAEEFGDFELFLDWKIYDEGQNSGGGGIFLRGTPQVQIGDKSSGNEGANMGSGGLTYNKNNPNTPLQKTDNPVGEWNNFRILMNGDRVTVYLNGVLVTDNVMLENFWDKSFPVFSQEQIALHANDTGMAFRDIFIKEMPRPEPFELDPLEKEEGFKVLFDGTNMHHWQGNTTDYVIENGEMVVHKPKFGSGGNLFTKKEYSDFVFRFEFKLTPGANNGLGIRAPLEGDAAYEGMEIQILDNEADIYKNLKDHQYHGSVYGIIPAERGYLKPVGEWNYQEVIVKGPNIKVILNGTTILDGNVAEASKDGTLDGREHPGLNRHKGHIGFLGHGSTVWFRNIRIRELD